MERKNATADEKLNQRSESEEGKQMAKSRRRRRLFYDDVIFEAIQFLRLRDVLLLSETNHRVFARPCRFSLGRLISPRFVRPLQIDRSGLKQENGFRHRFFFERILESLPFPQVPPPPDSRILGIGRVTINLQTLFYPVNAHLLARISTFLSVCETLFREHDLLLDRCEWMDNNDVEQFAASVFSQLSGGLRTIEADIRWIVKGGGTALLQTRGALATKRLLLTDDGRRPQLPRQIRHDQFKGIVDWINAPTSDGELRTLIICSCSLNKSYMDTLIPMIVKSFKSREENNNNSNERGEQLPKFCVLVLFPEGFQRLPVTTTHIWKHAPRPFHLPMGARGDALSLEPISYGCDHHGRPFSELVNSLFVRRLRYEGRNASFLERHLFRNGNSQPLGTRMVQPVYNSHGRFCGTMQKSLLCGYILRRDVLIGPWARPELFEARHRQRYEDEPEPEKHKLLHIKWS